MADYNIKGKMSLETGSFISSANAASASLNKLDSSSTTATTSLKYLKRGALAAGVAMAGLGAAGIKAASDYEQANIAFTKMLGSAEKSAAFIKELQDFAAATPFELPQLLAGSKKLMAFGFAAEEVIPMLTAIGDAASGLSLGSEGIDRLTLALGQMSQKGKVQGGELRQLAEAGVPALKYLADAMGVTQAKVLEMSEKGLIPAKEGIDVLIAGMEQGSATGMGFAGMMEAQSKTMAGLMSTFKDTVRNAFVNGFQKYVPAIGGVFEKIIPKVGGFMNTFIKILGFTVQKLGEIASGVYTLVAPLANFLVPAFKALGAIIAVTLTALGALGKFIKSQADVIRNLVIVLGSAAVGYGAYRAAMYATLAIEKTKLAYTKLLTAWQMRQAIATNVLTKAQRLLNITMAFNPIALIVGAVAALVAGFVLLWNKSEMFRKIIVAIGKIGIKAFGFLIRTAGDLFTSYMKLVSGPLRLLLKGLDMLGVKGAGSALDQINGAIKSTGSFFDSAANKVEGYSKSLDGLVKKEIPLPGVGGAKAPSKGITKEQANAAADALKKAMEGATGGKGAKAAKGLQTELKDIIRGYNDFIENDFKKGFTDGSEKAKDTILKSLDEVKKVFDFMGKNLSGAAAKKLKNGYDALSQTLRNFIPVAEANAKALEEVTKKLEAAQSAFEDALAARAEGAQAFAEMLRQPFGQPSALTKALSSASADVDSIIGMYDQIVEAINKRYQGIDPAAARRLTDFITTQTTELVRLAKKREFAVKALEDAQNHLNDVLAKQADFAKSTTDSMNSYAKALINVSDADTAAVISVTKTATGYVISQLKSSGGAIDSITNQLKERLSTITGFANNIKALLAKGLNKEYIEQLLSAGPEAAGQTAMALTTASDDQLAQINSLYDSINTASTTFGTDMATVFYGNSVAMAQAFVAGASAELENINLQMTTIKDSITAILAPLRDEGFNVGTDLALGMVRGLEGQRAALIATAQSIADQMVAVIAAAFASIGGMAGGLSGGGGGGSTTKPTKKPITTKNTSNSSSPYMVDGKYVSGGGFTKTSNVGAVNVTVNSTAPITTAMTTAALKLAFDKAAGGRKL